jgi:hypothetical protein
MAWPEHDLNTGIPDPNTRHVNSLFDANLQGYLSAEHNADGTHSDIEADSLSLGSAEPLGDKKEVGRFIDIAWSSGLYSGIGGMGWTVTAAQQVTYCYELVNHKMTVIFRLQNSTIGAGGFGILLLALPLGMYATRVTDGFGWALDASLIPSSTIITVPTVSTQGTFGKFMSITRLDGAGWRNGVAPYITGQLTYPV